MEIIYDFHKPLVKLTAIFVLALIFAMIFYFFMLDDRHWFILQKKLKKEITYFNMVIYCIFNFTTLGMADILPKSEEAKGLSTLMCLLAYIIVLA